MNIQLQEKENVGHLKCFEHWHFNAQIIYKTNTNDIITKRKFLANLYKILSKRTTMLNLQFLLQQKKQNIAKYQTPPRETYNVHTVNFIKIDLNSTNVASVPNQLAKNILH